MVASCQLKNANSYPSSTSTYSVRSSYIVLMPMPSLDAEVRIDIL